MFCQHICFGARFSFAHTLRTLIPDRSIIPIHRNHPHSIIRVIMVNTGKPSRGCYMCRARRIKCDEAKPSCMRCQKSKRVCPGYRDAFELKLRDESKAMKKKSNRRQNQSQSTDNPSEAPIDPDQVYRSVVPVGDSSHSGHSHSRNSSVSSQLSQDSISSNHNAVVPIHKEHTYITAHMTTPIHQQAACYFLANFVLIPEAGTMRGYLAFILPLMKTARPTQALLMAFSAVALASLGTRPNSKALLPKAEVWYLKALKEINQALRVPEVASSASTLASIMLLASFEQLMPSKMKVGGWNSHLDGAVAVIKSQPLSRWKSAIGRELFFAVRSHHTIHCIANSKAADLDVDWMSVESDDPIINSLAGANLKMAALRADNDNTTTLRDRSPASVEKVLNLLRRAEALDLEYAHWMNSLPPSWGMKIVAYVDDHGIDYTTSLVFPGRVLAYGELWMAYFYNIVRACRIFVWTTVLRCVAWLGNGSDYRLTPEYSKASSICRQLIEDITASVPYFFSWNRDKDINMADRSNFACGEGDNLAVKGLSGIFIMWPIFSAISSDFASPTQRVYLRSRLKYIAEMMGINQAVILLQAQLQHPSLYIVRERLNLRPQTCHSNDTHVSLIAGVPSLTIQIVSSSPSPPPPSTSTIEQTWITPPPLLTQQSWASPEHIPSFHHNPTWTSQSQDLTTDWTSPPHNPATSWTSPTSTQQDPSPSWSSPPHMPTSSWTSPTLPTSALIPTQPHIPLPVSVDPSAPWLSPPQTSTPSSTDPTNTWNTPSTSVLIVSESFSAFANPAWSSPPMERGWGSPLEEIAQPNWIPRSFHAGGEAEKDGNEDDGNGKFGIGKNFEQEFWRGVEL